MISYKFSIKSPEKAFIFEQMSREIDDYEDMEELKTDFKAWIKLCLKQKEMVEDLLQKSISHELDEKSKD